jgi:hypothetical protein
MLACAMISNIVTVHKRVKIDMADGSNPPHKFTDLRWKYMWLTASSSDDTVVPLFDVVIPFLSRQWSGGAVATYHSDNEQAVELIKKIKLSIASWIFGCWVKVCQYKLVMVQKLIESFDVHATLLTQFSVFNTKTLDDTMEFGDAGKCRQTA